jgi:signal transduction histidine kinase
LLTSGEVTLGPTVTQASARFDRFLRRRTLDSPFVWTDDRRATISEIDAVEEPASAMATRHSVPSSAGLAIEDVAPRSRPRRTTGPRGDRALQEQPSDLALAREQSAALARALAAQNDEMRAMHTALRDQRRKLDELRAERDASAVTLGRGDQSEGAFVAKVSHELRTPLHAMLALSQLLLDELVGPLSVEQRKYLEVIDRNAQNLLRLAGDLLDLSRIQAGALAVEPRATDIAASVRAVVLALSPLASAKGLPLEVALPDALPPAWCDAARLEQVLTNLIGNAVKFTATGAVTISAALDPTANGVRIDVTDTGIGIAEDAQPRIFDEFFQADPAHRKHGAGLGLAIARHLTEVMGGQIGVASAPGAGSRFTVRLPLGEEGARGTHTPSR